jgi:hypothetical protein
MTSWLPAPFSDDQDPELFLRRLLLETGKTLHKVLCEVLALELEPQKSSVFDLDDETYLRTMAEDDRASHIRFLLSQHDDREGTEGLAQTPMDKLAHVLIGERLTALVKCSLVGGEEATGFQWSAIEAAAPGHLYWDLDAIDGSALEDTVSYGFSSNVLLYRRDVGLDATPLMSVTVTSSGRMLGWIAPNRVGAAQLSFLDPHVGEPLVAELLEPLRKVDEIRADWIAVVAAQPKDRTRAMPLFASHRWNIQTLGGAPALPGLLLGRLSAVVILDPQTRHDATPLLALASGQGLHFLDVLTGRQYTDAEVRGFFNGFARPGTSGYLPIPGPMVIARERSIAIELVDELQWHCLQLEREREDLQS